MRVLVVDDHPLFMDGLAALVQSQWSAVQVDRAETAGAAVDLALGANASGAPLDFIFLDLTLRDTAGIESLRLIRTGAPSVPVVVVSADESAALVHECIGMGAMGYVPKTSPHGVLIDAVQRIIVGGVYLPEWVAHPAVAEGVRPSNRPLRLSDLDVTPRQIEVFRAVVQGKPNKLISRELGVSESTIKKHVSPVLKALGVTDRLQAIVALSRRGIRID